MSTAKTLAKLAETKNMLARKYMHLARLSKSKPRRQVLLNRAEGYRRQAIECTRA